MYHQVKQRKRKIPGKQPLILTNYQCAITVLPRAKEAIFYKEKDKQLHWNTQWTQWKKDAKSNLGGYGSTHTGDSGSPIWLSEQQTGKPKSRASGTAVLVATVSSFYSKGTKQRLTMGTMTEDEKCIMLNTKITDNLLNWIKIAADISKPKNVRSENQKIYKLRHYILNSENSIKPIRW